MVKPIVETIPEAYNINIKVVGVGNGGASIITNIYKKIENLQFIIINTDASNLKITNADVKILIGEKTTKGRGTGKDPEKGKFAAMEDKDKLAEALKNTQILFLIAALGGGTGTGSTPVIARIAKDLGAITIALVTTPFDFEGKKMKQIADDGKEVLLKSVDTLVLISKQKLYEVVDDKTSFATGFDKINEIVLNTISFISDLIYKPKLLDIDFADICSVIENAGRGIVGHGCGKGENRMREAVQNTIDNPLIEKSEIMEAKNILLSITGGSDLTLKEVGEAVETIQSRISSPSRFLGVSIDENLNNEVKMTLLATGIGKSPIEAEESAVYVDKPKTDEIFIDKPVEEDIDIAEPTWIRKNKGRMEK